jgi:Asp-tRNA(Asn)/Glu-tRNA(Gln) amidotransferase B subunit
MRITDHWLKKAYSWGIGDLLELLEEENIVPLNNIMLEQRRLISLIKRGVIKRSRSRGQVLIMMGRNGQKVLELLKKIENKEGEL